MSEDASGELSFYCKAYPLRDVKRFAHYRDDLVLGHDGESLGDGQSLSDDDVVFIHPDYSVTRSVFHPKNPRQTPDTEWVAFCSNELGFRVPDDLVSIQAHDNPEGR